jgi:hypothetical protein
MTAVTKHHPAPARTGATHKLNIGPKKSEWMKNPKTEVTQAGLEKGRISSPPKGGASSGKGL